MTNTLVQPNSRIVSFPRSTCVACAFENFPDRTITENRHYRLVFNPDDDLIGFTSKWESHNIVITQRGRMTGFKKRLDLRRSRELEAMARELDAEYNLLEMPQHMLEHFQRKIKEELENLRRRFPKKKFVKNNFNGITQRKIERFAKLTDESPLILPPDIFETNYDFTPIFVQRGCMGNCPGCNQSSKQKRFNEQEIEAQYQFFRKNYPNTSLLNNGLVIAGEDPLIQETSLLVKTMEIGENASFFRRKSKPSFKIASYDSHEGFAYMFFSFRSLKNKSVEDLKRLREAGLRWANAGLETADTQILSKKFPKQTLDLVEEGIAKCQKIGVNLSLNIIAGLGERDEEQLTTTLEFLRKTGFNQRVYISRFKRRNGKYETNLPTFLKHASEFARQYKSSAKGIDAMVTTYPAVYL